MELLAVVLLTGAVCAAYLTAVWLSTESRAIRFWAIWALVGSLVLGIDSLLTKRRGADQGHSGCRPLIHRRYLRLEVRLGFRVRSLRWIV
jgi:hypothetical protein